MARRKMKVGVCRICKKTKELSFEHIPPKAAFNKLTKFRSVPYIEYVQNSRDPNYKPTAKLQQGGTGDYCLCQNCNSFLGQQYVTDYLRMAHIGRQILTTHPHLERAEITVSGISPLRLLKQIIAMFICIHDERFTEMNPELLEFIKNPTSTSLPDKYRIFIYLNNRGVLRNLPWIFHNQYGMVSEHTFPPLGIVIKLDETPENFNRLTEITNFKNVPIEYDGNIDFELYNLPTYTVIPIDYRTENEIDQQIKKSEEFMRDNEL